MKGKDLIKWIQENKVEEMEVTYPYLSASEAFGGYSKNLNPRIIKDEKRIEL